MKKNLLLTTALVAFSLPAMAMVDSRVNGEAVTKTDYNITLNEPTNNVTVAYVVENNGVLNLEGTTSIETTATSGTNRGLSVQSNKSAGTKATVNMVGKSANFSLTNGLAQALFSSGGGSLINVTADSLDVDVTSNSNIAYGLSAQMGGTITTAENTTTTIDTSSTANGGYAIGVYLNEQKDGSGTPDADIDGGNVTLNGTTTIKADGRYAYGVLAEKLATNSETKGSRFTTSNIDVKATGTELAYGIRVESNTTATIGKANLVAEGGEQAIGLDVRNGSNATLSDNATISATSTSGAAYGVNTGPASNVTLNGEETTVTVKANKIVAYGVRSYNGSSVQLNSTKTNITTTNDNGESIAVLAVSDNNTSPLATIEVGGTNVSLATKGNLTVGLLATQNAKVDVTTTNLTSTAEGSVAYGAKGQGSSILTFSNNTTANLTATGDKAYGLYLEEKSTANLNGNVTVSGSTSDIHNDGTLNVNGDLTLAGTGISGTGTVVFNDATLKATLDKTTIVANSVEINNSTLDLILGDNVTIGKHDFITVKDTEEKKANLTGVFTINNTLYNISHLETGEINVETKSADEITSNFDASATEANALIAAVSGTSNNQYFNDVANTLSAAAQNGDATAVKEAGKLGADVNPIVSSQETGTHEVLFSVVNGELNGESGAMAGMSSGDVFKKVSAWVRGLFNKADHESTSKASGFSADTYGVAMGIDSEVNANTRLGFGYANSQTDIESAGRDTDVDTNSLFVYSQYKPANWYINTVLAYSWSEYDESKSVAGYAASAKYDVDTIALQSMYGYETKFRAYDVTPEFGFRYLHIDQDAYTDKLGTNVSENSEDVLTLVAGAKIAKNYKLDNGAILRPELKAAVTYDLFDADNSANVMLANGASYTVDGEKLNRLGFEFGAKVTTNATDKVEVSAGYLTRVREDYQDHTVTLDARYNF